MNMFDKLRTWPGPVGTIARYAFAVFVVAATVFAKLALRHLSPVHTPLIFSALTTLLITWAAGIGPGVLSVLLSAGAAAYSFIEPVDSFAISKASDISSLYLGVLERLMMVAIAHVMSSGKPRLRETPAVDHDALGARRGYWLPYICAGLLAVTGMMVAALVPGRLGKHLGESATGVAQTLGIQSEFRNVEVTLHKIELHAGNVVRLKSATDLVQLNRDSELLRGALKHLHELTKNNPLQHSRVAALSEASTTLLALIQRSLHQNTPLDPGLVAPMLQEMSHRIEEMLDEESLLLTTRQSKLTEQIESGAATSSVFISLSAISIIVILYLLFADNKQRLRLEADLRLSQQRSDAANRAKSEFLANMSHEIRTPMNGIVGMTELCLDTPLSRQQKDYLTLVRSSAQSLLAIINDILDFSKIESGKLTLVPQPFDLRKTVGDLLKTIANRAHKKGVELIFRCSPELPASLVGDSGRLGQVILNLVGNGIKFTTQGEVELGIEVIASDEHSVALRMAVRDTGIGIAPEAQVQIFKPFEQADAETGGRYGGTGLGLSISRRIVELMGGELAVSSEPGVGSCFYFTATFGRAASDADTAARPEFAGQRALVIDDNAASGAAIAELLQAMAIEPTLVRSSGSGLQAAETAVALGRPFDLAFLDLAGDDGIALATLLRSLGSRPLAPIMMFDSYTGSALAERCRGLGLHLHLTKPVVWPELVQAIAASCQQPLPATESACAPPRVATASRPLAILVIEDSPLNQLVAKDFLERWGHEVVLNDNALAGLASLERRAFDLVLMDLRMPGLDGYGAIARLRSSEQGTGRRLPVIALTAQAMGGDRERCLAAGFDDYVSKPFDPEELRLKLDATHQRLGCSAQDNQLRQGATRDAPLVFDWPSVMKYCGDDHELFRAAFHSFRLSHSDLVQQIRSAIAADDSNAMAHTAHRLAGFTACIGAAAVATAAKTLEQRLMSDIGAPVDLDAAGEELLAAIEAYLAVVDQHYPALSTHPINPSPAV